MIFEYSNRLSELGHDVTVLSLLPQLPRRSIAARIMRRLKGAQVYVSSPVEWFDLRTRLILSPTFNSRYLPDGDAVIATAWRTAYHVNKYPQSKGKKFYFIQHYETWDGDDEFVDKTWTMPLRKIVVSSWLKKLGEERFGQESKVVTNPIDFAKFYCEAKMWNKPRRIGMLYHTHYWKGIPDAKKAFCMAKQKHPSIRLVVFGARPDPKWPDIEYEYYYRPSVEKIRRIYCSCDIWLCASLTEGFGLTNAEAMACKCAFVGTDVGGVRDYAIPEETALLSPPGMPEALAGNLIRLIENEQELKRISEAGYNLIRKFTWKNAVKKFENELLKGIHD